MQIHNLFTQMVYPRPIAWIGTISKRNNKLNLAPYSSMNVMSAGRLIYFGASRKKDGSMKDTIKNIAESRDFSVNIVTRPLVPQMNITSKNYDYGVSEFEEARLTPEFSRLIKSPMVRESPASIQCDVIDVRLVEQVFLVTGKVVKITERHRHWYPIGRGLGYDQYIDMFNGEIFYVDRPRGGR